ncbi:hypothetical protein LEP1GSC047_3011 [Leptospira inadai serovar Lyme str. 10]|uniref:Uncharacterized protein n=1 Tax=Leptospira inadai serovar Lyme str. 10 TaxID=1049790 RepID=V6HBI7_9LEPT|nr:hypothetical protein LEP1GSC047_3011 [Leptospira inadai serovar Lyme str. 10]
MVHLRKTLLLWSRVFHFFLVREIPGRSYSSQVHLTVGSFRLNDKSVTYVRKKSRF